MAKNPQENDQNKEAGQQAAGNGKQPSLNVLTQYVKDLSFESPGAPQSLRNRSEKAPAININVNVNANPLGGSDYDVLLTLNARAARTQWCCGTSNNEELL